MSGKVKAEQKVASLLEEISSNKENNTKHANECLLTVVKPLQVQVQDLKNKLQRLQDQNQKLLL